MPTPRLFRAARLAIPSFLAAMTLAPETRANSGLEGFDVLAYIVVGGIVCGVADVVMLGADVVYVGDNSHPALPWSIAKAALGAPQAVIFNGLAAYDAGKNGDDQPLLLNLTLLGAATGALGTNGIWSLAGEGDPRTMYGLSWAIGANTAFTSVAIGGAVGGHLPGVISGVAEMVGTAPSLAVGVYRLLDPNANRAAWGALTGWSGALFLHGVASVVEGAVGKKKPDAAPPDLPQAPQVHFAPTLVIQKNERAMGFFMSGFF